MAHSDTDGQGYSGEFQLLVKQGGRLAPIQAPADRVYSFAKRAMSLF